MRPTYASMAMINEHLASLDSLEDWAPKERCNSIQILRLDKLHPIVSGNKWFKLKYHIAIAENEGKNTLLSFGGGYSNHLIATAYAAQLSGLFSIGIVRGHYEGENLTDTLRHCASAGMQLIFLNKQAYSTASRDNKLNPQFTEAYIIPEGGYGEEGIRGAAEIANYIPVDTSDVCVAVGSGTTFLGLRQGLPASVRLHGFYVARDFERGLALLNYIPEQLKQVTFMHRVADDRFGKWGPESTLFIRKFSEQTGIPLDVVYTSKMMMALEKMLLEGYFKPTNKLVCIHTGGLQGNPKNLFQ